MRRAANKWVLAGVIALGCAVSLGSVARGQEVLVNAPMAAPVPTAQQPAAKPAAVASVPAAQQPDAGAREIRRAATPEATGTGQTASSGALIEAGRVVGALALVLVLIVVLRYVATHVLGMKATGPGSNRGVRVISRTVMGPKQQLVLLQVGRKLVLVGESAGQLTTLTEIVDPDEVAELAAQASGADVRVEKFTSALNRRASEFDEFVEEEAASEAEAEAREPSLSDISARVRDISRRFATS